MSMIALVIQQTNATFADVLRVAREGGSTAADWDIAYAIAQVTDQQDPYRFMLTAGRRGAAEVWAESREEAPAPAPTNPKAVHDPKVHIYEEPTGPDAPNTVLPDHPRGEEPDEAAGSEAEAWVAPLHRTLARYARSVGFANKAVRIASAAQTVDEARRALYRVLSKDRRTNLFGLHPEPVALAA